MPKKGVEKKKTKKELPEGYWITKDIADMSAQQLKAGLAHLNDNNLLAAQEAFENVVRVEPENAEAHHGIGFILQSEARLLEKGDPDRQKKTLDAEKHFEKATELDGTRGHSRSMLGILRYVRGDYAAAEEALARVGLSDVTPAQKEFLAHSRYMQGKFSEAMDNYYGMLRRAKTPKEKARITRHAAWAQLAQGKESIAKRHFAESAVHYPELSPENPWMRHTLDGKHSKALALLRKLEEEEPGNAMYEESIGHIHMLRGDPEEARKHFIEAEQLKHRI